MNSKFVPLGVHPEYIWAKSNGSIMNRVKELKRAISEYMKADLYVNPAWLCEYNRHVYALKEQRKPFKL